MVEHLFCKQAVAGSNPIAGSILRRWQKILHTARWCNGSTNDSDSFCLGSSPSRAAIRRASASLQLAHGLRLACGSASNGPERSRRAFGQNSVLPWLGEFFTSCYTTNPPWFTVARRASNGSEPTCPEHVEWVEGQACRLLSPPVLGHHLRRNIH
jgi:hypothetical protein